MTLSNITKNNLTITKPDRSYDYAIEDMDIAIEDYPSTFDNQAMILNKSDKNTLTLVNQSL
jgi:hypothetical protein